MSEEPRDDDRAVLSDAVPEPDGPLASAPPSGSWDVLPGPPKHWPTLSHRNEDVALAVSAPQHAIPASEPRVVPAEAGDLKRSRNVVQMLGRLFATIGYEALGGTGPESSDLYSGGGMLAVAILAAVVSLMILIGNAVAGSTAGMVVGAVPCILAVALGVVGGRRFRRKDLRG